jgi:ribosomal protein RSM22 (predicted rRNA methylase)
MHESRVAWKALLATGALFTACTLAASSVAAADAPVEMSKADLPKDDYYTRRAKSILDAEKAGQQVQHPLAAAHPGMDIVVCEAGCPEGDGAHIVFARNHVVATEGTEGSMQPTSANGSTAASESNVACVGGCYDKTSSPMMPVAKPAVGAWFTTVKPAVVRDKLSPVR